MLKNVNPALVVAPFDGDVSVVRLPSLAQVVRLRSCSGTTEIVFYDPQSVFVAPSRPLVRKGQKLCLGKSGCIQFAVYYRAVKVADPIDVLLRKCSAER